MKKAYKKILLIYRLRYYRGPNKPEPLQPITLETTTKSLSPLLVNDHHYPQQNLVETKSQISYKYMSVSKLYSLHLNTLNLKRGPYQTFKTYLQEAKMQNRTHKKTRKNVVNQTGRILASQIKT
jgi:hypothetical protein